MINLFAGLKAFIVGVLVSVGAITTPVAPAQIKEVQQINKPAASSINIVVKTSSPSPLSNTNLSPVSTPLPQNKDNYQSNDLFIQGTYSYLGQSIKYLFLVPKNGGGFSGSIGGACEGTVSGEYEGGNSGKISGRVSGDCNFLFIKSSGLSTGYKGFLYPDSKKIVLEIENSPIKGPLTINYN